MHPVDDVMRGMTGIIVQGLTSGQHSKTESTSIWKCDVGGIWVAQVYRLNADC
jgi:hypothetical protein